LLRDLELDRSAGFLLNDRGTVLHTTADAEVAGAELHEITAAQLAVDSEIEQRKIACPLFKLEPDADGPGGNEGLQTPRRRKADSNP
jgi:hypothetical protein